MKKYLTLTLTCLILTTNTFAGERYSDDLRDLPTMTEDSVIDSTSTQLAVHEFASKIFEYSTRHDTEVAKQKVLLVLSNEDLLRTYLYLLTEQFEALSPKAAHTCLHNLRMALAWWDIGTYNFTAAKAKLVYTSLLDVMHRHWIKRSPPVGDIEVGVLSEVLSTPLKADLYLVQDKKDALATTVSTMAFLGRTIGEVLLVSLMNSAEDSEKKSVNYATKIMNSKKQWRNLKSYPILRKYRDEISFIAGRIERWELPNPLIDLLLRPIDQVISFIDDHFSDIDQESSFEEQKAFTDKIRAELRGGLDLKETSRLAQILRLQFDASKKRMAERLR